MPYSEIDLGDRIQAKGARNVDEESQLDTPTFDERDCFKDAAATCVFAAKWLHDPAQLGIQMRDQWACDEFGDTATTGGVPIERPAVAGLDESDRRFCQERPDEARHEVCSEGAEVRVEPADQLAVAREERLPQDVALAGSRSDFRKDRRHGHDSRAGPSGNGSGVIGRAVVEDDDLVDESDVLDKLSADRFHDRADGLCLVSRWEAHRHRRTLLELRSRKAGRDEVGVTPRRRKEGHWDTVGGSRFHPDVGTWHTDRAIRAHRERPRDGPEDAAATSYRMKFHEMEFHEVARCQCPNDE